MMASWTATWNEYDLMDAFQRAGVPAGVVQNARDLHQDPPFKHRGHYWFCEHAEMGVCSYDGPSWRMSRTPAMVRAAPTWAEANDYAYRELLGLPDDEYAGLLADGALE
jgi:crotonobetainyl-CoA:carnitine CoA-transferase CaiB-like acyl-CoA transferase